jgi:hypothetical protein
MNCLPNQRSERANQKHKHEPAFRNASNVGRAGPIPSRLVCETKLSEGRDRKIPSDLNQKSKTSSDRLLPSLPIPRPQRLFITFPLRSTRLAIRTHA